MTKKILKAIVYFVIFCWCCKRYNEALEDAANAVFDIFEKGDDSTAA